MNRQRGFTLIELIITVTIAAIVLAIGVPSFQGMMRNNRITAHTNDFLSSLNLARSEAIKRGQRVALAPTVAGDWGQGWTVFVDVNDNGQLDDGVANTIRVHEAFGRNATLRQSAGTTLNNYISFAPSGLTRFANSNAFQAGRLILSLCDSQNQQINIVINSVGRAQATKETATVTCTD